MKLLILTGKNGQDVAINTTKVTYIADGGLTASAHPDPTQRNLQMSIVNFIGKTFVYVRGTVEFVSNEIRMHRPERNR